MSAWRAALLATGGLLGGLVVSVLAVFAAGLILMLFGPLGIILGFLGAMWIGTFVAYRRL